MNQRTQFRWPQYQTLASSQVQNSIIRGVVISPSGPLCERRLAWPEQTRLSSIWPHWPLIPRAVRPTMWKLCRTNATLTEDEGRINRVFDANTCTTDVLLAPTVAKQATDVTKAADACLKLLVSVNVSTASLRDGKVPSFYFIFLQSPSPLFVCLAVCLPISISFSESLSSSHKLQMIRLRTRQTCLPFYNKKMSGRFGYQTQKLLSGGAKLKIIIKPQIHLPRSKSLQLLGRMFY